MIQEKPGNLIIISSPSGAGKTTITKKLLEHYKNLDLSVSVTTRKKREGEIESKDYYFVNEERFSDLVKNNELLEHAIVFGNSYGTPKQFVLDEINAGRNIIFDIDWQGARQITKHKEFNIITIFILPPSIAALKKRLLKRNEDSEEIIAKRMVQAESEISHYNEYDYVILNDDMEEAVDKIKKIIDFYSLNSINPGDYKNFVKQLIS
jgi:guanylate kinase